MDKLPKGKLPAFLGLLNVLQTKAKHFIVPKGGGVTETRSMSPSRTFPFRPTLVDSPSPLKTQLEIFYWSSAWLKNATQGSLWLHQKEGKRALQHNEGRPMTRQPRQFPHTAAAKVGTGLVRNRLRVVKRFLRFGKI